MGFSTSGLFKNASPYWIVAASLAFWFLVVYAPASVMRKGQLSQPVMVLHLIGAYPVYISCVVNTLITPFSFQGKANGFHTWLGRIGLIFGLIGAFPYGIYYSFIKDPRYMTIVSFVMSSMYQLLPTYFGVVSIREYKQLKKQIQEAYASKGKEGKMTYSAEYIEELKDKRDQALSSHVFHMITCFVLGCAGPAGQRLFLTIFRATLPPFPFDIVPLCWTLSLTTQLGLIRPFHFTYFKQTKDVREGNPFVNLLNIAKKVCTDVISGQTIHPVKVYHEVYTQGLLFANIPGPNRAPTLIKKQKKID